MGLIEGSSHRSVSTWTDRFEKSKMYTFLDHRVRKLIFNKNWTFFKLKNEWWALTKYCIFDWTDLVIERNQVDNGAEGAAQRGVKKSGFRIRDHRLIENSPIPSTNQDHETDAGQETTNTGQGQEQSGGHLLLLFCIDRRRLAGRHARSWKMLFIIILLSLCANVFLHFCKTNLVKFWHFLDNSTHYWFEGK